MAIIEPSNRDIERPDERKQYSSSLRLWHWLSAIVISGSLLTVLANSTITNGRTNAAIIRTELSKDSVAVTADQARGPAHEISDKVWEWHTYFGYTLAALLLFRLITEIFQPGDQKLIRKIKVAYYDYYVAKKNRLLARHEFVVKSLYAVLYILLMIMAATGLCLAFEDDVPALKKIHAIREVHGFCMYLIIAFIIIHLAGVFFAERKDGKGIVSAMINGGKADQ
jgi:Ni/Fe-hydrogenase 1 B-type cytochrome subunit